MSTMTLKQVRDELRATADSAPISAFAPTAAHRASTVIAALFAEA